MVAFHPDGYKKTKKKQTEVISSKIQQFQSNINEVDQLFTRNLNARNDLEGRAFVHC